MAADRMGSTKPLKFADPSLDPSVVLNLADDLIKLNTSVQTALTFYRFIKRLPTVEYAIGFDGVDDWIRIEDLNGGRWEIESKIWISESDDDNFLIDISDEEGDRIFGLFSPMEDESALRVSKKDQGNKEPLLGFDSESWHNLRIWSNGNILSIEVDGDQIEYCQDDRLKHNIGIIQFGADCEGFRPLNGMMKYLDVQKSPNRRLKIQAGKSIKKSGEDGLGQMTGLHALKKSRFGSDFIDITSDDLETILSINTI